jgi:hypothetical protein
MDSKRTEVLGNLASLPTPDEALGEEQCHNNSRLNQHPRSYTPQACT